MGRWKNTTLAWSLCVIFAAASSSEAKALVAAGDSTLTGYIVQHCLTAENTQPNRESVILFVDFLRFGCISCLNQFLEFCDTLKVVSGSAGRMNVVVVIKRDRQEENIQSRAMRSWLNGCGLNLAMTLVPADVFPVFGVEGTALMILDRHREFVYFGPIPVTPGERKSVVDRIIALKRPQE